MNDMEILIDTNVVLDWLLEREPFLQNAKAVLEPCLRNEIRGYLTGHTILNIFYIARKHKSVEERKEILLLLCKKFNIIGIDREMIVKRQGLCRITKNLYTAKEYKIMFKKENITAFENQLKEKLSGNVLTGALELISHLESNNIYPDSDDSNWFKYSGEMIFYLSPGKTLKIYTSNFDLNYDKDDAQKDELLEKYVHSSINKCAKHKGCLENPGLSRVIFGKDYDNLCRSTLFLTIPPLENLPYIKKIAEMRKHDIDNMPDIKRKLRLDVNETLDYKFKARALDFADYLYGKYELKHIESRSWEVRSADYSLCKIQFELGKWILALPNGEQFENPKFKQYDRIKELIESLHD